MNRAHHPATAMLRHVSGTLSASVALVLMVAVANILIARLLGVRGQGQVAAATLLPMIVAYAGELGVPTATGYLLNRPSADRIAIVSTARSVSGILAILLIILSIVLTILLPIPDEVKSLSLVYSLFPAVTIYYRLHLAVLQAELSMGLFNGTRIAAAAVYVGGVILYALTDSATVFRVVLFLLLANIIGCGLATKAALSRPVWSWHPGTVKRILSYGVRAHIGTVPSVDALKLDQLILAMFLSTQELGLYVAASTVIIGNRIIGVSLGMVCFPLASRQTEANRLSAVRQFRMLLLAALLLSGLVTLAEVAVGGRLLAALFGEEFSAAGPAFTVLAVGSIFANVRQVSAEWLRGSGRPGTVAISEVASILSSVVCAILLWDGTILRVAWIVSISAVVGLVWLACSTAFIATGPQGHRYPADLNPDIAR